MEFLKNRRSWENQKTPENRQKSGLFWASPFIMHLVCTLLITFSLLFRSFELFGVSGSVGPFAPHNTRGAPFPVHMAPRIPKILLKTRTWYEASRHVYAKARLRNPEYLGQKSCRTNVPRIFRIFVPDFAPNVAPNFLRIFRGLFVLRFVGDGDQKNFTKNPRHFSMQNSQATSKKKSTKVLWRAGKAKNTSQNTYLVRGL